MRSRVVRRHHGIAQDLHHRVPLRCSRDSPRTQPACGPAPDRRPVSRRLPSGRIPHPQDAVVLPLRKEPAGSHASPLRPSLRSRLRNRVRRNQNRKTGISPLELVGQASRPVPGVWPFPGGRAASVAHASARPFLRGRFGCLAYTGTDMQNTRRVAMVTGASSGIGEEFARRLARDGFQLMLVARRPDLLEKLASELGGAETLPADLTLEADLARVEARIASAPELQLLVNNAGFGTMGRFWETPLDGQERMHLLHVMATMRLTRAALAAMVTRASGAVINVSSVAGFGQSPGNISYCATKTWMNSFTEGLDLELRGVGSPVRVQAPELRAKR